MKAITVTMVLSLTTAAHAEINLTLNGNGLFANGNVGGIEFNHAPRDPVVPAPYTLTAPLTDQHLALQNLAVALTMNQPGQKYVWESYQSGNYGRIDIYAEIDGVSRGCTGYMQTSFMNGQVHEEWFTACPGGGNVNTWIVNNRWIVNSVDRARFDDGCRVRFADVRLDRDRLESTALVCYIPGVDMWKTEG
jgi:hypothetical protein